MKKLFKQIMKFGLVGVIATLIDYVVLIFLTEVLSISPLISAAISFTVSVIFNYIASVKWVFDMENNNDSESKKLTVFIVLSIIGLLINEFIIWILDDKFGVYYIISKLVATAIVMCWNFISRKIFLEKNNK